MRLAREVVCAAVEKKKKIKKKKKKNVCNISQLLPSATANFGVSLFLWFVNYSVVTVFIRLVYCSERLGVFFFLLLFLYYCIILIYFYQWSFFEPNRNITQLLNAPPPVRGSVEWPLNTNAHKSHATQLVVMRVFNWSDFRRPRPKCSKNGRTLTDVFGERGREIPDI